MSMFVTAETDDFLPIAETAPADEFPFPVAYHRPSPSTADRDRPRLASFGRSVGMLTLTRQSHLRPVPSRSHFVILRLPG